MQSVFCGTRNPLSYDGCKSSERRQSPSEVGSAPNSPPTHPSQREVFFKSSNKKKQMLRRFLSFSQLVSHAVPTCFLSFPNPGGGGLPPLRKGTRENRGTDEHGPGRRRLLRGDKGNRCGGRTLQERLHLAVCRVFLVFNSFTLRKLCSVVRGDVSPVCVHLCVRVCVS